jgi:AcrR family transcriptional regulator
MVDSPEKSPRASRTAPRTRRGPGRPAADERPETRDALLDAASHLFARHGAARVSLRRVADEAGVSPAMVHYYFGDKDGLYDAMLERTFGRLIERVTRVADGAPPDGSAGGTEDGASDRLAEFLAVVTSAFTAEPWIPALMVREVLSEEGRFRERFIQAYASRMAQLLPGLMRDEIAAGRFRDDLDPRLAFLSLMGMAVFPFVARPVVERVLGIEYDAAFVRRFADHTRDLFVNGARS